jgi:hypothetical protein
MGRKMARTNLEANRKPKKSLREVREEQEMSVVEKAITDYYSSLTNEEATEQALWGGLATREFPIEIAAGCPPA